MKKQLMIAAMVGILLIPVWAFAIQVEGTVRGLTCVTQGKICPVDKEDPLVAATRVLVVTTQGNKYYFVPNLDRAFLARYVNKRSGLSGA